MWPLFFLSFLFNNNKFDKEFNPFNDSSYNCSFILVLKFSKFITLIISPLLTFNSLRKWESF